MPTPGRSGRRAPLTPALRQLARLYGVQTAYYDFVKRRTEASGEAVLEAVRLLGAPVHHATDASEAVRLRTRDIWTRVLEPVAVIRPALGGSVEVRLPARAATRLRCTVRLEDGTERRWVGDLRRAATTGAKHVDGTEYVARRLVLPRNLPTGYHELRVDGAPGTPRCLVIAAPPRAFAPAAREWGVFLPLYALHSADSWGAGDFTDLERLQTWAGQLGAGLVSILPVLASYPQSPFDPSPYAPSSRLFWNEFYVDPRRTPEFGACPRAQELVASAAFEREIDAFRAAPLVDYDRQRTLRRRVLEELAGCLAATSGTRRAALQRYVEANPRLPDYAAFSALLERRRTPWRQWPEPQRSGVISAADRDRAAFFYHLYVQWQAEQQMAAVASRTERKPGLYLDLPLGVHAHGFDTWRFRDAFALEACGGAPPDAVFTRGQNWQFPPLHPEGIRAQGYRYFIECLRHQLTHAASLRIDHVMSLHRLYWIPGGWPASEGVYVQYRAEELYGILCLESHRHRATIVGENLGTVPAHVNAALTRNGVRRMYVVQYEIQPTPSRPLGRVGPGSVASLNTHDMPPFTAYLRGLDLRDRLDLGLLRRAQLPRERATRHRIRRCLAGFLARERALASATENERALTAGSLAWLAASPAAVLLVNLEDLWLETESQNLPGTGTERPNWRRRTRYALEQLATHPDALETLRLVADTRARRKGRR